MLILPLRRFFQLHSEPPPPEDTRPLIIMLLLVYRLPFRWRVRHIRFHPSVTSFLLWALCVFSLPLSIACVIISPSFGCFVCISEKLSSCSFQLFDPFLRCRLDSLLLPLPPHTQLYVYVSYAFPPPFPLLTVCRVRALPTSSLSTRSLLSFLRHLLLALNLIAIAGVRHNVLSHSHTHYNDALGGGTRINAGARVQG